ncbi:Zinc finger protein MAGPIE [Hibiscus syriacus]|uniref:Zinc finger protein MAGPIE n=1 Tax=Hibiscus syriacus TaxID=106335 RepID=A0A6A3CWU3_HIBSY|nr:Zinc finger protein MAGPIE [Hibiscus syriacus]
MAEASIPAVFVTNPLPGSNPPLAKKKRNLPGTPDPEAEVIALSPKTLMATNRFLCEICGKGFQRDQNLQLHRRGHNLPWKLKQRDTKEPRKRVYVCPEKTCVHHHPSRALGDLTGIKKHFCRKHGEKKWKCDKCSKRYAVRDSFITHRAFCDALAEETARINAATGLRSDINYHLMENQHFFFIFKPISSTDETSIDQSRCGLSLWMNHDVHQFGSLNSGSIYTDPLVWTSNPPASGYQLNWVLGNNVSPSHAQDLTSTLLPLNNVKENGALLVSVPSLFSTQQLQSHQPPSSANMSATALLQKAAQIGTTSTDTSCLGSLGTKCSNGMYVSNTSPISIEIRYEDSSVVLLQGREVDGLYEFGGCFSARVRHAEANMAHTSNNTYVFPFIAQMDQTNVFSEVSSRSGALLFVFPGARRVCDGSLKVAPSISFNQLAVQESGCASVCEAGPSVNVEAGAPSLVMGQAGDSAEQQGMSLVAEPIPSGAFRNFDDGPTLPPSQNGHSMVTRTLRDLRWNEAVLAEYDTLVKNGIWVLEPLPVGCKWLFKVKYNVDGSISRYKACLVAGGFSQVLGHGFNDTFTPVVDVHNTFFNGDLREEVYMVQLSGFEHVASEGSRLLGFHGTSTDASMFIRRDGGGHTFILVYVDDIIITGESRDAMTNVARLLSQKCLLKDMGELGYFLGIEVHRTPEQLVLSQLKFVRELLRRTGMVSSKLAPTPMVVSHKLTCDAGKPLADALIIVDHGLVFQSSSFYEACYVTAFADADWASNVDDRRSVYGSCVFLGCNLVSWSAKRQKNVVQLTTEAEYRSIADTISEVVWVKSLFIDMDESVSTNLVVWSNNTSAIAMSANPVFHARSKNIELDLHFVLKKWLVELFR